MKKLSLKNWIIYIALATLSFSCGSSVEHYPGEISVDGQGGDDITVENDAKVEAITEHLNTFRSEEKSCGEIFTGRGSDPVEWSSELEQAALRHAQDMVERERDIGNVGSDGSTPRTRVYEVLGEFVDVFQVQCIEGASFESVLDKWVKNPTKCLELSANKYNYFATANLGSTWVLILSE